MEQIPLPNLKVIKEENNSGVFEISPLYPSYGQTIANSLRRVLLASLPGTAVDSVKIEGVDHEFSSINNVKEDVVEIILNLKSMPIALLGEAKTASLVLDKNSAGDLKAGDFTPNAQVKILDPEHKIATINKGGSISMTVNIKKDRGFVPSENKSNEKEIGLILLDSFYSPVKHVSFQVEDTRVGQTTNYNKIILTIETNGSILPKEAIEDAAQVLTNHFAYIANINPLQELEQAKQAIASEIERIKSDEEISLMKLKENNELEIAPPLDPKTKIEDLEISGRTKNALIASGFKTLSGLKRLSEIKLAGIKGLGTKGLEEVTELLKRVEE